VRLELLEAEKELTRRSDELARRRHELPWVRVDKEYRLETDEGQHPSLISSEGARSPNYSAIADGFDDSIVHVANHDVTLGRVSRAPLANLQAYKRRRKPLAPTTGHGCKHDTAAHRPLISAP
jgi:predicted dithiol-disulfide oxidoreductase (DUF899 family)